MILKPQDVVMLLKLAIEPRTNWIYSQLAHELCMSASEIHKGIKRATQAGLFDGHYRLPKRKALEEFLVHGVKYAYPPDIGTMTRGIPTAFASPMLRNEFVHDGSNTEVYVWPHPEGEVRGIELSPLYRSVPDVARRDEELYAALGLLDAIRIGRARERRLAEKLLLGVLADAAP